MVEVEEPNHIPIALPVRAESIIVVMDTPVEEQNCFVVKHPVEGVALPLQHAPRALVVFL